MSKIANLKSQCICGHEVEFRIRKPTRITPSIGRSTCKCGSRYMFRVRLAKARGSVDIETSVLELSEAARKIAREAIKARAGA